MALFAGPHLLSMLAPASRDRLKRRWGETRYKLSYSLVSVAGVLMLAWGYVSVRIGPEAGNAFYQPLSPEGRPFILLLILAGFILMASNGNRGHLRFWVGHPFSLGVILWSAGHLMANGEKAVVLIFALFMLIAVLDVASNLARGRLPSFEPLWSHDIRSLVAGVAAYLILMFGFHPYILGIPAA